MTPTGIRYYVWFTGLAPATTVIYAPTHRDAVIRFGMQMKACHHGETMHVNVQEANPYTSTRRYFVQLRPQGVTFL